MLDQIANINYSNFLNKLKERVSSTKYKVAFSVNRELILLYHHIGNEILTSQEKLGSKNN
jgi:hypothetical protein